MLKWGGGAILRGTNFLTRQAFQKCWPHQKYCRAHLGAKIAPWNYDCRISEPTRKQGLRPCPQAGFVCTPFCHSTPLILRASYIRPQAEFLASGFHTFIQPATVQVRRRRSPDPSTPPPPPQRTAASASASTAIAVAAAATSATTVAVIATVSPPPSPSSPHFLPCI